MTEIVIHEPDGTTRILSEERQRELFQDFHGGTVEGRKKYFGACHKFCACLNTPKETIRKQCGEGNIDKK